MKNQFDPHTTEGQEVHAPRPKEQQYRLIGSMRKIPGLKLYAMDMQGRIEEVEIKQEAHVGIDGKAVLTRRTQYDLNKWYTQAINPANAKRKFTKQVYRKFFKKVVEGQ